MDLDLGTEPRTVRQCFAAVQQILRKELGESLRVLWLGATRRSVHAAASLPGERTWRPRPSPPLPAMERQISRKFWSYLEIESQES